MGIKYGFGRHVWDLNTTTAVPKVIMYDYLTQTFGIAGGTLGRISFIVFVIQLLGTRRSHRVILWVIVGLQIVTNVMLIIILFVQCPGHGSAIWTQNGKDKCWDYRVQAYYGYYQGCTSFHSLPWSTSETNNQLQQRLIQPQTFTWQFFQHTYSGT